MWSIRLTLLLVSSAVAQNASNTIAGVSVKIQGQSGKMTLSNEGDTSGSESLPPPISFFLHSN